MSDYSTPQQAQPLDPDLLRAHQAYEAAINSNDTDQVMAMYDKDAMVMQPDGETVSGLDNIRQWVEEYFGAYQTHWTKVVTSNPLTLNRSVFDVLGNETLWKTRTKLDRDYYLRSVL